MRELAAWAAAAEPADYWIVTGLLAAATLACFWFTFRYLRKARLIENVPTSRIRSAAQGYVELEGTGRLLDGPVIVAPLSGLQCLWWDYKIEQKVTTGTGKNRRTHWRTIASGTSDCVFALDDDTGRCVVDPGGARVITRTRDRWRGLTSRPMTPPKHSWLNRLFGGDFRYTERRLGVERPLYAMGWFATVGGPGEDWNTAEEVRQKLVGWKRDRETLVERFDANDDGQVDLEEWEAARKAAEREVAAEQLERALEPGVHVMRAPPQTDNRPYLLSGLPQELLVKRFRTYSMALLAGFLCSGAFATLLLTARYG